MNLKHVHHIIITCDHTFLNRSLSLPSADKLVLDNTRYVATVSYNHSNKLFLVKIYLNALSLQTEHIYIYW